MSLEHALLALRSVKFATFFKVNALLVKAHRLDYYDSYIRFQIVPAVTHHTPGHTTAVVQVPALEAILLTPHFLCLPRTGPLKHIGVMCTLGLLIRWRSWYLFSEVLGEIANTLLGGHSKRKISMQVSQYMRSRK